MIVIKYFIKGLKLGVGVLVFSGLCIIVVFVKDDINIDYEKFIIDNGFIVIVYEDCKVLVVVVVVWYKVGFKDELEGKLGFVYLFEYLMFNGFENYDDEWFGLLQEVGVIGFNGIINFDCINYFQIVLIFVLE